MGKIPRVATAVKVDPLTLSTRIVMTPKTVEKQYQFLIEEAENTSLGLMSGQVWRDDPRRLTFLLSRYKFVSKMLSGYPRVLEIGCADGFGSRIVRQEVGELVATDIDPIFIEDAKRHHSAKWPIQFRVHDMLSGCVFDKFDATYCCDVMEHILPADEDRFIINIINSMKAEGIVIIGSPSLESQIHASPASKEGHVNCKSAKDLKSWLQRFFFNTFIFSMNDEVIHTGFYPMAHYLFAVCSHIRPQNITSLP